MNLMIEQFGKSDSRNAYLVAIHDIKKRAMQQSINCPFCGGEAKLTTRPLELTFRGKNYEVTSYFYACDPCKEEFTDTDTDTKTLDQIPGYEEECFKKSVEWLKENIVGKEEKDLKRLMLSVKYRVYDRDGENYMLTMDLNPNRFNLKIEKGVVTSYYMG